jgi:PAS domain S-box-containing protein
MESNLPIIPTDEQFKIMADTAPVLIWIANVDKLCYSFNAAWLRYTGRTLEQEYGDGWSEGIHPDDRQRYLSVFHNSFDARTEFKIEYRLRRFDGKYLWLLNHGVPRFTNDGAFAGYVGSCMIIDELLQSERIKTDFVSVNSSANQQDLNEELASANEQLASSNEELAAINDELLQTQESLAQLNSNLEETVSKRTKALAESELALQALNDELTVTVNELSKSEHNTRNIVANAPFPIGVYTGANLRIALANQAMIDVWGKGNEVIGKLYTEVLPELGNQQVFEQLERVFTTGQSFHARNQRIDLVVNGEQKIYYFNYSFTALRDQSGEVYAVMNTAADVTDIVLAKLEVEQSEKNLHNMVRQAPVGMCILKGSPLYAVEINDVFLEIVGKERDRFKDAPYWVVNAEAAHIYEPITSQVLATGESYHANEHEIMLKRNGVEELVYVNFVYEPIKDVNGKVDAIMVVAIEVTDQVNARRVIEQASYEVADLNEELAAANEEMAATNEEITTINEELRATNEELTAIQDELTRSEKLFRSIALNIPGSLIVLLDKYQRYVAIEGDMMPKLGYDDSYIGKHPSEVLPLERYEASRDLYERVLAGEKVSLERKSAGLDHFMVHLVPLKNGFNEVEAGLIIALDITDIKEAEEKSAKLAAIIESSDDAIISKTLESVITSWNESAERIFGYKADEIIGETIYKLIPEDRKDEEPRILSQLKGGERVEHFETQRMTKDGRLIDVSITVSPVKDKQGNIIGLSKIARDITERKKDDVRKNDFIGMVSHELKTPLTSLNAILQVANAKLKNSEDKFLSGAMYKANAQVKRMSAMINGFLNISRLESGKILIEKSTFDMEEMIQEVIDETNLTGSSHSINFTPGNGIEVYADAGKINSVISNLISNAIKYSSRGQQVNVGCVVSEGKVVVSIADKGIGIEAKDAEKIFERYYRVEANHTQHISGFGIGLYLSAEIIKRHGGDIWVESEIGKGSTFYFSLPL